MLFCCVPCYTLRKQLGTAARCPWFRTFLCSVFSQAVPHGLGLCLLHMVTTTAVDGASDSDVSPAHGCVPIAEQPVQCRNFTSFQHLFDEMLLVASSRAVLNPSLNPNPDNQPSLAVMVKLVNMNE